jgi:hypothetical protein
VRYKPKGVPAKPGSQPALTSKPSLGDDMFFRGGIYRHVKCLDVDMRVNTRFNVHGYTKLKVSWIRQKDHDFVYTDNDRVIVEEKDFKYWKRVL